ncbi:S-layer family protein [Mesorhizobium sp. CGMCC 1.15528]|uniref:S-layer family protein n=1 Tax=Mesorhizobium zhangyense TaxID=1776730 RepID=A0A7C9R9X8_9HYPH|nr:S-layer family protein [Mesorhizobium zhangyense]NGN41793.1 S-layer family protein [Mesorhizobium zhangyense]
MSNKMKTKSRLLGSVGTTVLATMIASGAHAGGITIDDTLGVNVRGSQTITGTLDLVNPINANSGAVGATISGVSAGISRDGTQIGVTETVSGNRINASATGNRFANSIDLSLVQNGVNDGAASLGVARNQTVDPDGGVATVTSLVQGSSFFVDDLDFQSGSVSAIGNTISAATAVNEGSTSLAGNVPTTFVSVTAGSSNLAFPDGDGDGNLFASTGSLVAGSVQQNLEGGHSAAVTGNAIGLSLASTDDYTLSGSPALDDNTISATLKGNTAGSTIDIGSADAPSFKGSAAVTNLQLNTPGLSDDSAAENLGSQIAAIITGDAADALYELEGGLSVSGNRISSSITGNEALGATTGSAGNRILLGDGLLFAGAGGDGAGSTTSYTSGGVESAVAADLIIHNSQGNQGVSATERQSFSATTAGGQVLATVQSIDNGSVAQSADRVTVAAAGNAASSALANGQNAASFEGTVALANQQSNHNTDLSAANTGATIAAATGNEGGVTHNSSIGVTGNRIAATGYGNDVSQSVDLDATILLAGAGNVSLTGGTASQGNVSVSGNVTISSLQSGYGSNLTVTNSGSAIRLNADSQGSELNGTSVLGSTLTVGTNAQEAIALGNAAGNALSLEGTTVGSGAGIANVQILDGNSGVSATLAQAGTELTAGTDVDGSTLSVTGNTQRAIGYGSSAANALSVSANAITVGEADAPLASVINAAQAGELPFSNTVGGQPVVNAAYGILNDQSSRADVTANADGGQIGLAVEGDLRQSSARNELNAIVAAAYGNDAASAIAIDAGNVGIDILEEGEGAAVANVTNTQAVAADISATASGENVILASVDGDVIGSSLSAAQNLIQALVYGNRATDNSVTVTGTNIEAAGDGRGGVTFDTDSGALAANASFSVQNAQSAQGSVTASQLDDPDSPTTAAGILVSALGDISGSSVAADGNRSLASATANSAANALSIDVNRLATTSGVQNFQTAGADVTALIGLPGTPPTPGAAEDTFGIAVTADNPEDLDGTISGSLVTLQGGTLLFPVSSLSSGQVDYLTANGWTISGGNISGPASLLGTISVGDYATLQGGGTANLSYTIPAVSATAGTPNQGGVTVAVGADIAGSSVSVSGNVTAGSVTGNAASNALKIAATDISTGSDLAASTAGSLSADVIGAVADHALSNVQEVSYEEGAAYIASRVHGAFAIDATEGATIADSSLNISDNTQSATAVANTAGNVLSLDGTNISAGSALASDQWGDAIVEAFSNLEIFAPAAVSGSSVEISGNTNTALGVINDATNTLSVTGTNIASLSTAGEVVLSGDLVSGLWSATGDHVLSNRQTAYTAVEASAITQLYNEDSIAAETSGLNNSSLTVSGNRTVSEASANRADNKLTLDAASTLSANGGIVNRQDSEAAVSALSATLAGVALAGDATSAALDNSSVKVDGNSTTSLARGNAATNVLNAVAGSSYGASTAGAGSSVGAGGLEARANAAVLNGQTNSGNVSAVSIATVYAVALNGTTGIANGSVSVSGNQIASEAYGNSAVNKVSLSGLNTGTSSAAVSSYQANSGAITASVTQAALGVTGSGMVGGSSLGVKGNTISANAVGNSVSNAISRN